MMLYFYKLISALGMAFFLRCRVTENNVPLSEIGQVICFQTQSFVNSKLCSKTLPLYFPSSFFLHPSRFRKNPHAAIVLAAAGYLPSSSTIIYSRDSFFFVILYCNRAHMQEALHTIHIPFLMLREPHPRTRRNLRSSCAPQNPHLFSPRYLPVLFSRVAKVLVHSEGSVVSCCAV